MVCVSSCLPLAGDGAKAGELLGVRLLLARELETVVNTVIAMLRLQQAEIRPETRKWLRTVQDRHAVPLVSLNGDALFGSDDHGCKQITSYK